MAKNKKHAKKQSIKHIAKSSGTNHNHSVDSFKKGLLEVDKSEEKYDKLFEQKLSDQYKEFRGVKEHAMQSRKFFNIFVVIVTIILASLLILSFG